MKRAERDAVVRASKDADIVASELHFALEVGMTDKLVTVALRRARQYAIWVMGHLDDADAARATTAQRASTADTTAGDFSRQQDAG